MTCASPTSSAARKFAAPDTRERTRSTLSGGAPDPENSGADDRPTEAEASPAARGVNGEAAFPLGEREIEGPLRAKRGGPRSRSAMVDLTTEENLGPI